MQSINDESPAVLQSVQWASEDIATALRGDDFSALAKAMGRWSFLNTYLYRVAVSQMADLDRTYHVLVEPATKRESMAQLMSSTVGTDPESPIACAPRSNFASDPSTNPHALQRAYYVDEKNTARVSALPCLTISKAGSSVQHKRGYVLGADSRLAVTGDHVEPQLEVVAQSAKSQKSSRPAKHDKTLHALRRTFAESAESDMRTMLDAYQTKRAGSGASDDQSTSLVSALIGQLTLSQTAARLAGGATLADLQKHALAVDLDRPTFNLASSRPCKRRAEAV